MPSATRNDTTGTGRNVERHEREDELRRIDVPLLVLEDRVVDRRIRRVAVEDRLGGRQIREANIPGEQPLGGAQPDEADEQRGREEDERDRQQAAAGRRRAFSDQDPEASAADLIRSMMASAPEGVVQPKV